MSEHAKADGPARVGATEPGDAATQRARVTVVQGESAGRRYRLVDTLTIGRGLDCDVVLGDLESSRRHALIERDGSQGFVLRDLGSRNGTFLNDSPVRRAAALRFGDRIGVGATLLLFSHHDEVEDHLVEHHGLETLGRLAAGVAHDLNDALAVLSWSVGLLADLPGGGSHAQGPVCLTDITWAAERAADLAHRLLRLTRDNRDGPDLIDVATLCDDVVTFAKRSFPRSIRIEGRFEPLGRVIAEGAQLHHTVLSLCVRARDSIATRPGGGLIRVTAVRDDDEGRPGVRIDVHDDGPELGPELLTKLFEPMARLGASRSPAVSLSTVADIVRGHGGNMQARSDAVRGTTFSITLPAVLAGERRSDTRATMAKAPPSVEVGRGRLVLIVDQDPAVRRTFSRVLVRAGFRAVSHTASEALGELHTLRPAIALVELDDDDDRFHQVVAALRQLRPLPAVVGVCSSPRQDRRLHAVSSGADDVIAKPCTRHELLRHVTASLRAHQPAGDELSR